MLQKPLILAIETSSRIGSIAVGQGAELLDYSTFSAPLRHSAEIFPAIAGVLGRHRMTREAIDQVYISFGPGSFTGLRIAVTIAKAMHLANKAKIVAVNSLDTIAANLAEKSYQNADVPERIATILDAKRGQFYVALYERRSPDAVQPSKDGGEPLGYRIPAPGQAIWHKTLPDCLMPSRQFLDEFAGGPEPIHLLGDGLLYHRDRFTADGVRIVDQDCWSPRADNVYALGYQKAVAGQFADPLSLAPLYLRGPQVTLRKDA